jgi:hypothetical protein
MKNYEKYYSFSVTMDQYNEVQNFTYRQVVGSLLFIAIWTRPDMAYPVNKKVAKHSHNPTLEGEAKGQTKRYMA